MEQKIISVTQLNRYIKSILDANVNLNMLYVRGEISNYKAYPSGHHYFTMKDEEASLRCVLFKREAQNLAFRPENGMKIIAPGRVSVCPRDRQYQLYCGELIPDGAGALHIAFEQLKEKLRTEGLFELEYKKPLPPYPERIALITSSAGAAVRDMLRILKARYPLAKILILPVRVQGAERREKSAPRCATQTSTKRRTLSSRDGAAARWRTSGPSTTRRWPARSLPPKFQSSPPWGTSQT